MVREAMKITLIGAEGFVGSAFKRLIDLHIIKPLRQIRVFDDFQKFRGTALPATIA